MNESFSVRPRMKASGADLDRAALHERGQLLGVQHVVERVEERAEVRIDLGQHVARQEAEPLAGLDRRAREDDPADLPLGERRDRERHREVGLARAGRADPEGDGRVADRVDVALLRDRLRRDLLAPVAPDDVVEDLADVLGLVERRYDRADRVRPDLVAALDELDELVHDRARRRDLLVAALDRELVPAQAQGAMQPPAQSVEHAVADAGELGCDLVRDGENFLHPAQCRQVER